MEAEKNLLDDVVAQEIKTVRRRSLLPVWIKIFVWIFMVLGAVSVPVIILGLFDYNMSLEIYGIKATTLHTTAGVVVSFVFLLKGLVALLLWFEQSFAIVLGLVDASLGILLCTGFSSLIYRTYEPGITFHLELIALIPYLVYLIRVKKKWEAA